MENNEKMKEQETLNEEQAPAEETAAEETAPEEAPAEETAEAAGKEESAEEAPKSEAEKTANALARAKKALAAQEDSYLRLAAEYDNFRRRSAKEKSDAYTNAKADAALKFLPVYDNLERALQTGTEDAAFLKGVEMTMTQLLEVLESLDIRPIEAVGKPFDPNFHNAVAHIDDESLGENTVAACFQTGFIMGEKVIRFAMVQVAN
jgi:molecular chaperone GrpE